MKKIFIAVCLVCLAFSFAFADDPPKPVAFSGNVMTGLRADITENEQVIYANEDSNGTPIWSNFRIDYSLDANAGITLNFRTKGTDVVSKEQSTFYPFLNRGFVWGKFADGQARVRSGYLWDSDFESSNNAWDTASNYEWVTELVFFPAENLEIGATVPTPYDKMDLDDALKNVTYGIVYSPAGFRFSAMGEYGDVEATRSINFGVDYTGLNNTLLRVEGDLQQVGYADLGYNQLFQEIGYTFGAITSNIQVTEWLYKDGSANKIKLYPNLTLASGDLTYFAGFNLTITEGVDDLYKQAEVSVKAPFNSKASIKGGSYFTFDPAADFMFSPYIEFVASF
jgi:hypothetical protein